LIKSLGRKTKTYKRTASVISVMGPRKGFVFVGKDKQGRTVKRNATTYGHLVEFGHRIVKGGALKREGRTLTTEKEGASVGFVPAEPFMRPAWEANKAAAHATIRAEVAKAVRESAAEGG
jgi:hypothetical protein